MEKLSDDQLSKISGGTSELTSYVLKILGSWLKKQSNNDSQLKEKQNTIDSK